MQPCWAYSYKNLPRDAYLNKQLQSHSASQTILAESRDCLHRTCSHFQKQLDRQQQNETEHTDGFFFFQSWTTWHVQLFTVYTLLQCIFFTAIFVLHLNCKAENITMTLSECSHAQRAGTWDWNTVRCSWRAARAHAVSSPGKNICFQEEQADPIFMWAPCGEVRTRTAGTNQLYTVILISSVDESGGSGILLMSLICSALRYTSPCAWK